MRVIVCSADVEDAADRIRRFVDGFPTSSEEFQRFRRCLSESANGLLASSEDAIIEAAITEFIEGEGRGDHGLRSS